MLRMRINNAAQWLRCSGYATHWARAGHSAGRDDSVRVRLGAATPRGGPISAG
jgi:hypothetical protein